MAGKREDCERRPNELDPGPPSVPGRRRDPSWWRGSRSNGAPSSSASRWAPTSSAAGLGVVAFSAGMAASRFVGDRLVARFGQPAVVRFGASSAFVALAAMLIVHRLVPSVVALGIVGLGLGPVVPLAFRTAGRTLRRGHASALPLVVTAGYAGSIVGPLLVGFIADLATLRIAFLVPLVASAVSALAAGATRDR